MKGKVKFFNESKGFGFIVAEDGKDIFVHVVDLNGVTLISDQEVGFDVEDGKRGSKAVNVKVLKEADTYRPQYSFNR
jgi:cold shock protein